VSGLDTSSDSHVSLLLTFFFALAGTKE